MQVEGWQYYNHAAIPTTMPYEDSDIRPVKNGDIWKIRGVLRFLRGGQVSLIVDMKRNGGM